MATPTSPDEAQALGNQVGTRVLAFRVWNTINKTMYNPGTRQEVNYAMLQNESFMNEHVVMQFTGLKDKHGVDIYEGDIVALDMWHGNEHGYISEDGVIKWHEASAAFKWFSIEEDQSDANNYWLQHADAKGREVIGNVFENDGAALPGVGQGGDQE